MSGKQGQSPESVVKATKWHKDLRVRRPSGPGSRGSLNTHGFEIRIS